MNNVLFIHNESNLDPIIDFMRLNDASDKIFVLADSDHVDKTVGSAEINIVIADNNNDYSKIVGIVCKLKWKNFRFQSAEIEYENGEIVKLLLCLNDKIYACFNDFSIFNSRVSLKTFADYFKSKSINEKILNDLRSFLASTGIYSNNLGYSFIIDAFVYAFNDRKSLNKLTSDLYPAIGKMRGKSGKSVERDIRSVIESSCNSGKFYSVANSIGGNFEPNEKPSNGEYLAFLVDVFSIRKY